MTKTDSFGITVSDGHGGTAVIPVSVAIGPANTAPRVRRPSESESLDRVVTGSVTGADADGDTVTYSGRRRPRRAA